jgi:hypothetical protein
VTSISRNSVAWLPESRCIRVSKAATMWSIVVVRTVRLMEQILSF